MDDLVCDSKTVWKQQLADTIASVTSLGTFACSACFASGVHPNVSVQGVGTLSLPLQQAQAAQLLSAGEAAPYGKGTKTVTDPAVRRATQFDASLVTLGPAWSEQLHELTAASAAKLGVHSSVGVAAHLYKLLVYEPGGHFTAHRDTEKEPGMFATLIVQLPVVGGHVGGMLEVRHGGEKFQWQSANGSNSHNTTHSNGSGKANNAGSGNNTLHYAAFFADCEHSLSPISAGLRLVLAYNLVRTTPGPKPLPEGAEAVQQITTAVLAWNRQLLLDVAAPAVACDKRAKTSERMGFMLEHQYTQTSLSFAGLKGRDVQVVRALQACELLDVHLALITKQVTGQGEQEDYRDHYRDYKRRRCGWGCGEEDEDEEEEEETMCMDKGHHGMEFEIENDISTKRWVSVTGHTVDYGEIALGSDDEAQDVWNGSSMFGSDDEVDEEEYEGHTGNAGPTVEYFYHRAIVMVWPRAYSLQLVDGKPSFGNTLATLALCLKQLKDSNALLPAHNVGSESSADLAQPLQAETAAHKGAPPVPAATGVVLPEDTFSAAVAAIAAAAVASMPGAAAVSAAELGVQATLTTASAQLNTAEAANDGTIAFRFGPEAAAPGPPHPPATTINPVALASSCGTAEVKLALPPSQNPALLHPAVLAVLEVLQFMVDLMQRSPALCFGRLNDTFGINSWRSMSRLGGSSCISHTAQALEVLTSAHITSAITPALASDAGITKPQPHASIQSSVEFAMVQLMSALCATEGIASAAVAAALAHATCVMPTPEVQASLAALMAHAAQGGQLSLCVELVASQRLADELFTPLRQQLANIIMQAVLGNATPRPMQQDAAQDAATAGAASATAPRGSAEAAAPAAVIGRLPKLAIPDVCLVARMICDGLAGRVPSCSQHMDQFVALVLARADTQTVLQGLLVEPAVLAAAAMDVRVRPLVMARLHQLEKLAGRAPQFSWRMPQAQLAGHPQVQEFLRGPQERATFSFFGSIRHARSWASKHFGYSPSTTYSARAVEGGRGKQSSCTVTKTRAWFDVQVRKHRAQLHELDAVRRIQLLPTAADLEVQQEQKPVQLAVQAVQAPVQAVQQPVQAVGLPLQAVQVQVVMAAPVQVSKGIGAPQPGAAAAAVGKSSMAASWKGGVAIDLTAEHAVKPKVEDVIDLLSD